MAGHGWKIVRMVGFLNRQEKEEKNLGKEAEMGKSKREETRNG